MILKRILILGPIVVAVVLLQSFFWVPTYERQTTGNPQRLEKFIAGSIGDAKILNPFLNSDTASSEITDLVFEGLLDLDENLQLRGRLATDWVITELAYLAVLPRARFPDGTPVTAAELERRVAAQLDATQLTGLRRIDAETRRQTLTLEDAEGKPRPVEFEVSVPERIEIRLAAVDQDLMQKLEPVLGPGYPEMLSPNERVRPVIGEAITLDREQYDELLPVLEHNPVIRFNLRQGVRFHDGEEFDADDVKFTYEAIMDPRNLSPRTSDFEPIKHIHIVDRHTIDVVYKRLFSPAINAWTMGIVPEHLQNRAALEREMERRGLSQAARETFGLRESEFSRNPVGSGPFRFVEWQSDELIHLERYEDYWEGPPRYRHYYYRVIPDYLTQEVEFRSGAVDYYAPQPHQIERYRNDDAYQAFSTVSFGFTYIGYNNRHPLLADPRVRRALGMAINRDEIISYVLYGQAEQTTGPYPKNTRWYDHQVEPLPYDPDEAQRILAELGWRRNAEGWLEKDGKIFEFNLITNNGNAIRKAVITIAQNNWRKIGIKCNTQLFEWAVFLKDFVNPGKFDAVVLAWSMGVDPDLYQIWHSSQAGPNQLNFVGYRNPEADRLILRIRREYDVERQVELSHRLHRVIAEDQPYTFLYAPKSTVVLDKKIVIVEPDGSISPVRMSKSGRVFYYFNRWRKLEHVPEF